jgi:hypothetical protein
MSSSLQHALRSRRSVLEGDDRVIAVIPCDLIRDI